MYDSKAMAALLPKVGLNISVNMVLFIFVISVAVFVFVVIVRSFVDGIRDYITLPKPPKGYTMKQCYSYYSNKEYIPNSEPDTDKDGLPHEFILDKLAAYDNQIESYYKLLNILDDEYTREKEPLKQAKIRAQQGNIMLKISTTQEKAYKLREKHGID